MLIVEDGTGVPNASSYVPLDHYKQWLGVRGFVVGADAECEAQLIRATDWLEVQNWAGEKSDPAQALAFPRSEFSLVPNPVYMAQLEMAKLIADGYDPNAIASAPIVSEKVDVLAIQYDVSKLPSGRTLDVIAPTIYQRIKPYLKLSSMGLSGLIDRA